MKKIRRVIWLLIFLSCLGLAIWIAYKSVVFPLSPDIEPLKRVFTYCVLSLMLLLIIISSIILANTIITRNNILKNYTRAKIFTLIKTQPGIHYSEIVRNLNLGKGQTTWHLSFLERFDMIRKMKSKHFVVYYPNDENLIDESISNTQLILIKSETRNQIFQYINEKPGKTQNDLMKDLNISQSTLAYHLIILEELNLITIQKKGRRGYYFINNNQSLFSENGEIKIPG
ncbi:MAG: ArsR family transcriptional regulator [Asgard group archaeon]|nr:ArsR family transcriptional regulator [Asgard group archaeon]